MSQRDSSFMAAEGKLEGPAAVQVCTFEQAVHSQYYNGDTNEYVLQLARSSDSSTMVAALSNRSVSVHDRNTLAPKSKMLKAHNSIITDVCFSPATPHLLASSSEDKTVRTWDVRSGGPATSTVRLDEEVLCCGLGLGGDLMAAGAGTQVLFYDMRNPSTPLGAYADVHTDLVTRILFHPASPTKLVTGAEDGLACFYDVGVGQSDEALQCIVNAECPIRHLTFFGPGLDGLSVLTGTDGLSLWHWPTARRVADLGDVRTMSQAWAHKALYGVSCHYDATNDELLLSTTDEAGHVTVARVMPDRVVPVRELSGGHTGLVRAVDYLADSVVTGGEDARLCLWNGQPPRQQQHQAADRGGAGAVREKMRPKAFKPY